MSISKSVLSIIAVFCISSEIFASPLFTDSLYYADLTIQNGLASNQIYSIYQDAKGFVWFGTSNGLCRYDGYEFVTFRSNYKNPEYFSSNTIRRIVPDQTTDSIYLVTPNGITILDPFTQETEQIKNEIFDKARIQTLASNGNTIYVATTAGLFVYDKQLHTSVRYENDASGRPFNFTDAYSLMIDRKGRLWVGGWRQGAYVIDLETNRITTIGEALPKSITPTVFLEDDDGSVYVSTHGFGLYKVTFDVSDNASAQFFPLYDYNPPFEHQTMHSMSFDRNHNPLLGTSKGLYLFDAAKREFHQIPVRSKNANNYTSDVWALLYDTNGVLWLSNFGNGVTMITERKDNIHEIDFRRQGYMSSVVMSVYPFTDDILWVGVTKEILLSYNLRTGAVGQMLQHPVFASIPKGPNSAVGFVETDGGRNIFMATIYNNVYCFHREGDRIVSKTPYLVRRNTPRSSTANCIAKDRLENIWVGTSVGIARLKRGATGSNYTVEAMPVIDSLINYCNVGSLLIDSKGTIWVGSTEDGLYRIEYDYTNDTPTEVTNYRINSSTIKSNRIEVIYEDSQGKIWIGTHGGGLSLFDKDKNHFEMVSSMHSTVSDIVVAIAEDDLGNLWISTSNGILCYHKKTGKINNYGIEGQYHNLSFVKGAVSKVNGSIIFGGYNGLSIFSPNKLLTEKKTIPPSIVDVQIFNESLLLMPEKRRKVISDLVPPYAQKITLSSKDYSVSIKFATPTYVNSSLNRYAYKLDGQDRDWNYIVDQNRVATYTNLRPGKYTFCVKGCDDRGNWSDESTCMTIIVQPPWWRTIYAFIAYVLFIALVYRVITRLRRRRLEAERKAEMEKMEQQRRQEMHDAQLSFFTNISHELLTPVTIISCSFDKVAQEIKRSSPLALIIRSNINRVARLLQQILEFRKSKESGLRLQVTYSDLTQFVKSTCENNFNSSFNDKNIKLSFSASQTALGYFDYDKLDKILYNLVSNAFKYNREGGKVKVKVIPEIRDDHNWVTISVKDTGYGIDPDKRVMIFNLFYESDHQKYKVSGFGIGLALTADLVRLHHGVIEVHSVVGEGSEFIVRLPLDRDCYADDEIYQEVLYDEPLPEDILPSQDEQPEQTNDKYTLLIVDDNTELLAVMRQVMGEKYNILTATDGEDALRKIKEASNIDIIITDNIMEPMNGVELCRAIRNDIETSHLPVIMISERPDAENKLESYNAGVDSFVAKPFDTNVLSAHVDSLITKHNAMVNSFRTDNSLALDYVIHTDIDKQFMDRAVAIIVENLANPDFDAPQFTQAMRMSASTLYRKIKSITGMAPKELIRNVKLKHACAMLMERSCNVTEAAKRTGFSNPKYFSYSFKNEFGMSPRDYIKRNRYS